MTSEVNVMEIPVPIVAPFGVEVTADAVKEVWDVFVKPGQDAGELQSVEDRILMAILRAVYAGFTFDYKEGK